MLGHGVRDLVPDHRGQLVVGARHLEQAGEDDDLAAGQAEGIRLLTVDERELPLELRLVLRADPRDALRHALHPVVPRPRLDYLLALVGKRLLEDLQPELLLLLVAHRDALLAPCHGHLLALRREVADSDHEQREHHADEQARPDMPASVPVATPATRAPPEARPFSGASPGNPARMDVTGEIPAPIEPDDLGELLLHELAAASEQEAAGLHVQLTVPRASVYEWEDADGDRHHVHLPTAVRTTALRFPGEPREDGGPAAVFRIHAGGRIPREQVAAELASELYRASVRWGRVHHVGWEEEPPPEALPPLPIRYAELVESALFSDVG